MKDKYRFFSIRFNQEEWDVLRKLKKEHGINLSASIKIFFKQKLEQLEKTNVNINLQNITRK